MIRHFSFLLLSFLVFENAFAQRNANQRQFKSRSVSNYNSQWKDELNELNQDLLNTTGYNYSQNTGVYAKNNEMIFEVRALMNAKANRYLAVFNLTQVGETAVKTDELLNNRINNFKSSLQTLGISKDDIFVDMIYMIPNFEYEVEKKLFSKTYNEVPAGFEMQKNVHIQFSDIGLVDDLVTQAAQNEIYDLVKLDYFVDNTSQVYDSLRNASIDYMNKKLTSFKGLNSSISDEYHTIREASRAIYPETQYSSYDAFVSQSIEAVKKSSGVTNIRKPKSVAYDQAPYNEFDVVINPAILEPVVQYIYVLQVKYILPEPEVKKNNYMVITPNGELKKVPVE